MGWCLLVCPVGGKIAHTGIYFSPFCRERTTRFFPEISKIFTAGWRFGPWPTIGIIAEYNPFHSGHTWHHHPDGAPDLRARTRAVICAMSGNWVQRGQAALADKWTRAELALRQGADLVLELPTLWAVSSAEPFARGGGGPAHRHRGGGHPELWQRSRGAAPSAVRSGLPRPPLPGGKCCARGWQRVSPSPWPGSRPLRPFSGRCPLSPGAQQQFRGRVPARPACLRKPSAPSHHPSPGGGAR